MVFPGGQWTPLTSPKRASHDSQPFYEPIMFGMHIGTVLSGLGIRNVNTELKMLSLPVFRVENG